MPNNETFYMKLLEYIRTCAEHGDRLPPEESLAKLFGVSRVKLRDSLAALQNDGYIIRKKGAGTLINKYILAERARLDIDVYFEELIESTGQKPSTLVRNITALHQVPDNIRARLEVPDKGIVYKIEKTIFADGCPAIFLTDYVPYKYYNRDEIDVALLAKSTFWFVQNYCDELLDNLIVHIAAINAEGRAAEELALPEGSAILQLSSICYNKSLSPIMYSVECYNTAMLPLSFQKRIILSKLERD